MRLDRGSSSNRVLVNPPVRTEDGIVFEVTRYFPMMKTADIHDHGAVWAVPRSDAKVHVVNGPSASEPPLPR